LELRRLRCQPRNPRAGSAWWRFRAQTGGCFGWASRRNGRCI